MHRHIHRQGDEHGIKTLAEKRGTHLAEEPGDDVAKDDGLVGFVVVGRGGDASEIPEITLPFVETGVLTACVEEENVRGTFDEPSSIESLYAHTSHGVESGSQVRI